MKNQTLWTVLGILVILLALAYSNPTLAQSNHIVTVAQTSHHTAFAPTPTATPVEPTQPTTRTTIMLPNIGSTGPRPAAPPARKGWVTVGVVAIILIASVGFVWQGKKRG